MPTISLRKMSNKLDENGQAKYFLKHIDDYINMKSDEKICMNDFIGKKFSLKFLDAINCIACQRKVTKTFNQGYCFPCFQKLAECDMCIVKPELCHFDEGTCRDDEFAEKHCNITHIIYCSLTSAPKIGITRKSNVPHRWIDQGAVSAIKLVEVNRRKDSGIIESEVAKNFTDKTNWRKMLKNEVPNVNLSELKIELLERIKEISEITGIKINQINENPVNISYPVESYPEKIKSHNFDKNPLVEGTLLGIKAQYLIFDTGVINLRKFAGYRIQTQYQN